MALSPYLPETLAVEAASRLLAAAAAAGVEVAWLETSLDAEFSRIRQRRADAGLGWLTVPSEALPPPLDVMGLGEFEPDAWLPRTKPGVPPQVIGLDELAAGARAPVSATVPWCQARPAAGTQG